MSLNDIRQGPILIVEDEPAIGLMLVDLLHKQGYETILARNGAEAMTVLQLQTPLPRLILLDLAMPNIDGPTFFATQRAHIRWRAVPVIALSALPRGAVMAMDMGVTVFMAKPFDIPHLLRMIGTLCADDTAPAHETTH